MCCGNPLVHQAQRRTHDMWRIEMEPLADAPASFQVVDDQKTERKENHDTAPEHPFVLLCPSLNHSDSVATYAQGVGHVVQSLLRPLQDFPLLPEIAQHGPPTIQILVKLGVGH